VPLSRRGRALAAAALLAASCISPVRVQEEAAPGGAALALARVAVAPFAAAPRAGAPPVPADAVSLLEAYVGDGLAERGLDVVPASDMRAVLGAEGAPPGRLDPRAVARLAHERFGADAVVLGDVTRFLERSGEALGSEQPASVGFAVRIHRAPTGERVWAAEFEETQLAWSDNVLLTTRYPGGGTRWLTAAEFARWGAREVTRKVPLAAP
jgi:hypothetical protein